MNILKPILIKKFDYHSYACVERKGQQKAVQICNSYVRKNKYALKCDISKFFPSINHDILFNMFKRIIKDENFLNIIEETIYSFKGENNCPIGNYTSQWFGNFYLTTLDNFCRCSLGIRKYVRYCDDFIIFSNDKKILNYYKVEIEKLLNKLKLKYSKANILNTKQGVDFCGYRSFGKYILLRKKTAKKIKKKLLKSKVSKENLGIFASYYGWTKHCNSYNFRKKTNLDIKLKISKVLQQHTLQKLTKMI